MIAIDINPILKSHLFSQGYKDIEIYPINGYGDSTVPFITWLEVPSVRSPEAFWLHQTILTYAIYDNDLSRCKNIAIILQKFLNVGDDISSLKALISSQDQDFRICWARFSSGNMFTAAERDGFYSITRSFEIGYLSD